MKSRLVPIGPGRPESKAQGPRPGEGDAFFGLKCFDNKGFASLRTWQADACACRKPGVREFGGKGKGRNRAQKGAKGIGEAWSRGRAPRGESRGRLHLGCGTART